MKKKLTSAMDMEEWIMFEAYARVSGAKNYAWYAYKLVKNAFFQHPPTGRKLKAYDSEVRKIRESLSGP
jgi:hypothetical protein